MAGKHGVRKRQTRLSFTPLPSSSPAAKGYNKQIQDRAATVTVESSPRSAKRRKVTEIDDLAHAQLDGATNALPTPAGSLQHAKDDVESEYQEGSEPIQPTQRRRNSRRKSQQQHIDFSRARHPDTFDSPIRLQSSSRQQSSAPAGIFSQPRRSPVDISSPDSDEDLPSPPKVMAKRTARSKTSGGSAKALKNTLKPTAVDSDSEGGNIVMRNAQSIIEIDTDDEDEDDDLPTTAGTQRRRRATHTSRSSFIVSSPPRTIATDDDLEIIEPPESCHRRVRSDDEIGDDSDEPATPIRRKLKRRKQSSQQEKHDLAEDMDWLEPSSDVESSARKPRNTQTVQKEMRQNALEQLKRKRSGQTATNIQEDRPGVGADEGAQQSYDESDDDDEDPLVAVSSRQFFDEEEDDQEFIDEDEDEQDPLGIPEGLPIEFSRYAFKKPKELFKYAVEWMVQKKINPAFDMNDPLYDLTFRKLDDEVSGLRESKFKSSVWTPHFTRSLTALPNLAFEPIDRNSAEHWMRDSCDACNRTGHPASYQIQFQGIPYHPETLDEVVQNEDDDDPNDSESSDERNAEEESTYDAAGREVPPASTLYYVGKFCQANAQTAHALQHWRFHLNEWVITWLERNGYTTPRKIVERDGKSTKKRSKEANRIVDRMEEEGLVRQLYHEFKQNIDDARNAKQGRYRPD